MKLPMNLFRVFSWHTVTAGSAYSHISSNLDWLVANIKGKGKVPIA